MALITAERLHRWKCLFCGSKDKNIISLNALVDNTSDERKEGIKIVTCSQCGRTEIYGHSALMLAGLISGQPVTIEESEKFVKDFHELNHIDPKVNPHATVGPKLVKNENT